MRDYTGMNPNCRIDRELVTPSDPVDNRYTPTKGSFYENDLVMVTFSDGMPFTDFKLRLLDAEAVALSKPGSGDIYQIIEFPNGLPEDIYLSYQAFDTASDAQTDALIKVLTRLAYLAETYNYDDVLEKPLLKASAHTHRVKEDTGLALQQALLSLKTKSVDEIKAAFADVLADVQPQAADGLPGGQLTIITAINYVVSRIKAIAALVTTLQDTTDPELTTTDKTVVGAINELVDTFYQVTASFSKKFDFQGWLVGDTDLSAFAFGSSKIWLVNGPALITASLFGGATSIQLNSGDIIYYNSQDGLFYTGGVGSLIASKQDKVDQSLPFIEKDVVALLNTFITAAAVAGGYALDDYPVNEDGTLSDTSAVPFAQVLTEDTDLSVFETETQYFIVDGTSAIHVTGTFSDGDSEKDLSPNDVIIWNSKSEFWELVALDAVTLPKLPYFDTGYSTDNKTVIGAVNEIYAKTTLPAVSDVIDFKGNITTDGDYAGNGVSGISLVQGEVTVGGNYEDGAIEKTLSDGTLLRYYTDSGKLAPYTVAGTGAQPRIEPTLDGDDKDIVNTVNRINKGLNEVLGSTAYPFLGYYNQDTDITSIIPSESNMFIAVERDNVTITAPFADGNSSKVLNAGDVVVATAGVVTTDTIENYPPPHLRRVESALAGSSLLVEDALTLLLTSDAIDGYQTADDFQSMRTIGELVGVPQNSAPVSRTTYSGLFEAIGVRFGAGDGSTTFSVPSELSMLKGQYMDLTVSLNGVYVDTATYTVGAYLVEQWNFQLLSMKDRVYLYFRWFDSNQAYHYKYHNTFYVFDDTCRWLGTKGQGIIEDLNATINYPSVPTTSVLVHLPWAEKVALCDGYRWSFFDEDMVALKTEVGDNTLNMTANWPAMAVVSPEDESFWVLRYWDTTWDRSTTAEPLSNKWRLENRKLAATDEIAPYITGYQDITMPSTDPINGFVKLGATGFLIWAQGNMIYRYDVLTNTMDALNPTLGGSPLTDQRVGALFYDEDTPNDVLVAYGNVLYRYVDPTNVIGGELQVVQTLDDSSQIINGVVKRNGVYGFALRTTYATGYDYPRYYSNPAVLPYFDYTEEDLVPIGHYINKTYIPYRVIREVSPTGEWRVASWQYNPNNESLAGVAHAYEERGPTYQWLLRGNAAQNDGSLRYHPAYDTFITVLAFDKSADASVVGYTQLVMTGIAKTTDWYIIRIMLNDTPSWQYARFMFPINRRGFFYSLVGRHLYGHFFDDFYLSSTNGHVYSTIDYGIISGLYVNQDLDNQYPACDCSPDGEYLYLVATTAGSTTYNQVVVVKVATMTVIAAVPFPEIIDMVYSPREAATYVTTVGGLYIMEDRNLNTPIKVADLPSTSRPFVYPSLTTREVISSSDAVGKIHTMTIPQSNRRYIKT